MTNTEAIALVIKDWGLFCGKLFLDLRYNQTQESPYSQKNFEKHLTKFLGKDADVTASDWLHSNSHGKQLLALTWATQVDLSKNKELEMLRWLENQFPRLYDVNDPIISYFINRISEKINHHINSDIDLSNKWLNPIKCYSQDHLNSGSPFYARALLRNKLGTFIHESDPKLTNNIVKSLTVLDDRFNNRITSLKLDSNTHLHPDEEAIILGDICSIRERINREGFFLIANFCPSIHRTRGTALLVNEHDRSFQAITAPRGSNALQCINYKQEEAIQNSSENWNHALPNNSQFSVRALEFLNPNALLITTSNEIGIAHKNLDKISWQEPPGAIDLWCQAVMAEDDSMFVAVAGAPTDSSRSGCWLYEWKKEKLSLVSVLPCDVNHARIRSLHWSDKNNLWAATEGKGQILHCRIEKNASPKFQAFTSARCPQYSVYSANSIVLTGGVDGVVRAFNQEDGGLEWTYCANGPVRFIQKQPFTHSGTSPVFLIGSEDGHISELDINGNLKRLYQTNGEHPINISPAYNSLENNIAYWIVSTLGGRVLLLGSLKDNDVLMKSFEQDRNIKNKLERKISDAYKTKKLLMEWLELSAALKEPLRASWAAHMILEKHHDATPVIRLLEQMGENIINNGDILTPSAKKLPPLLLGALGKHYSFIGRNQHDKLTSICEQIRDGALASLLGKINTTARISDQLLEIVLKKSIEEERRATTASLWQYLRNTSDVDCGLTKKILEYIFNPENPIDRFERISSTFAEGLCTIWYRKMNPKDDGILLSMCQIDNACLPNSIQNNSDLAELFNTHAPIVFSITHERIWRTAYPFITNDSGLDISAIMSNCPKKSADYNFMLSYKSLLPDSDSPNTEMSFTGILKQLGGIAKGLRVSKKAVVQDSHTTLYDRKKILINARKQLEAISHKGVVTRLFTQHFYAEWKKALDNTEISVFPAKKSDYLSTSHEAFKYSPDSPSKLSLWLENTGPSDIEQPVNAKITKIEGSQCVLKT